MRWFFIGDLRASCPFNERTIVETESEFPTQRRRCIALERNWPTTILKPMAPKGRTVDLIDKLSFPFFALAIAAEYLALKSREKRTLGDLADADFETLSGTDR